MRAFQSQVHFFRLFYRPDWDFDKMDILKNVQNRVPNIKPGKVVFSDKSKYKIHKNIKTQYTICRVS